MGREFEPFGPAHFAVLALLAAGCWGLVALGRRVRGTPRERTVRWTLAGVSLALVLPWQIWTLLPGQIAWPEFMPFELCDLAWLVSIVALLGKRRWACGALYYWGLTLTTQAIATPRIRVPVLSLDFVAFWAEHLLVVWAAVFLTWGLGYRPTWRALWGTAGVTVGWVIIMFGFNSAMGTNYLFVNHKPLTPSLLDVLGPWPVYLGVELLLALAIWGLITWPWTKTDDRGFRRAG